MACQGTVTWLSTSADEGPELKSFVLLFRDFDEAYEYLTEFVSPTDTTTSIVLQHVR